MCGILGIYQENINKIHRLKIENGLDKLKNRGPNQNGIFQNKNTILGHTRLSIIDTSIGGKQPISDNTENYQIIYNGEFYNYKQERDILVKKGYQFKTQTDTEVLLYMYIAYGVSFLEKINGCFALAIYNNKDNEILIARDRFGIKPLYYSLVENKLKFASELKGLLPLLEKKELDINSLQLYFQFNYIPDKQSIIKNVQQIEPGTYLSIKHKTPKINRYYQINYNTKNIVIYPTKMLKQKQKNS
jgi:asparagine synthase (glutamine-hydrolysing)